LESGTFDTLLQQAKSMAVEYSKIKEKYILLKTKHKELATKHEKELKHLAVPTPI
jgi:hypothetical protein